MGDSLPVGVYFFAKTWSKWTPLTPKLTTPNTFPPCLHRRRPTRVALCSSGVALGAVTSFLLVRKNPHLRLRPFRETVSSTPPSLHSTRSLVVSSDQSSRFFPTAITCGRGKHQRPVVLHRSLRLGPAPIENRVSTGSRAASSPFS